MASANNDEVLKRLVFIGDSGVGKTALVARICGEGFLQSNPTTIGIDFKRLRRTFGDVRSKLELWDSSGQDRFRSIVSSYYRGAHAILVVYDVGNRQSFDNVRMWMQQAEAGGCADLFLVATKAELPEPAVPSEEGQKLARDLGVPFMSCSAQTGEGIEELLETVFSVVHKPPVVLTVMASRGGDGRLWLSCLRVSGAEAGRLEVDAVDRPCCDALPELRRACGLKASEPAYFVTVAGARVPETPYEYLPEREEVCVALGREELLDEHLGVLLAALEERGLCMGDVEGDPKFTSQRGQELSPSKEAQEFVDSLCDADYPVRCQFTVKRRRVLSIDVVFPCE